MIGIAVRAILMRCLKRQIGWFPSIVVFVVIFAVIDLSEIPMLNALEIAVTIGNEAIAKGLNATPNMPLSKWVGFNGVGSVVMWILQAIIACFADIWCLKPRA